MDEGASDADLASAADLWHAVCDAYAGIEVASRHALDDFALRPEDFVAFGTVVELRSAYTALVAEPKCVDPHGLLDDLDQRLSSLEGRIEILRLAAGEEAVDRDRL